MPESDVGVPTADLDIGRPADPPTRPRSDRVADVVFAVAAVAASVAIVALNRRQWFFHDDFVFAFERDVTDPVSLLRPHFGHNTVLPSVVFQAMYQVLGLRVFWPYQVLVIASHVAVATLLRAVMLRCRVDQLLATSAAILFLFYGSGRENLTWAFQTTLNGSIAFGFAALLVADHDGPSDRRDLHAALLLCASVLCSNLGPFMAGVVAVAVIVRRGPRSLGRVVGPPVALFVLWRLTAPTGREARDTATPDEAWVWGSELLAYGFRSLTHVPVLTAALAVSVLVALVLFGRRVSREGLRSDDAVPVAVVVGLAGVVAILGVSRGGGVYPPFTPRYAYMVAVFSLPTVAWSLSRLAAGRRRWAVAASALLLLGLPANVGRIGPSNEYDEMYLGAPELVAALGQEASARNTTPGYEVYGLATSDGLIDAYRRGEIPDVAISPEVRARAALFVSLGAARSPSHSCRTVDHTEPLTLERGDRLEVDSEKVGVTLLSVPGEPSDSGSVPDTDGIRGFDVLVDQIELLVRPETSGTDVRVCRSDRS